MEQAVIDATVVETDEELTARLVAEAKERRKKQKKPFSWSEFSFIFGHYFLPVLIVIVFYFYANGASFFMAFQRAEGIGADRHTVWTMYNFKWIFKEFGADGIMLEAVRNTLMWWFIQMALVVIGLFTSYFIYKRVTGSKIFRVVFLIPGLMSSIVLTFIIQRFLSSQGFIAEWIMKLDGLSEPPDLLYDERYCMTFLILKGFPFAIASNMIIWVGTMSRIPDGVIESGKLDGAGWFTEMTRLVLPMIMTAVGITLCSNVSGLFNANGGEFLYTKGSYGTMTLNTYLYLQVFNTTTSSNTHNQAAAVGWLMTLVLAPLILITRHWMNKLGEVEY